MSLFLFNKTVYCHYFQIIYYFQFSLGVLIELDSFMPDRVFEANHPFYFALYTKSAQKPEQSKKRARSKIVTVLFSGRLTNINN